MNNKMENALPQVPHPLLGLRVDVRFLVLSHTVWKDKMEPGAEREEDGVSPVRNGRGVEWLREAYRAGPQTDPGTVHLSLCKGKSAC